ncbi:MAG: hypothetical protein OEV08_15325 [Nitrospira sp.]|nr:hypothetical protein [Nitrospira sp.]
MPQLTHEELSLLLPHAGAMRLLGRVESWDEQTIRCCARSHRDPANPLRTGVHLEAVAGLEYAAQAMGVHVGLLNRTGSTEGTIGYLGGLRDVVFDNDRLDDYQGELTIEASRLLEEGDRFMYQFSITSDGRPVLRGRASIFLKQVRP